MKKKVKQFQKEFGMKDVTYAALCEVVEKQGYTIIEFNNIFNDKNVALLIEALNLSEQTARSKGFTYADSNYRLVFVHEDLTENEKLVVLSHEAGHIYCGHLSNTPIIGRDVQDEYEANEFSHYLLKPRGGLKKHKKLIIGIVATLVILIAGVTTFILVNKEKQYYGEYYITSTGDKYHEEDCIFVKDKKNARRITEKEFESGDYESCKTCLP